MNLPTFVTRNANILGRVVQNNSPAILTVVGVAGVVGTAVLTSRATVLSTRVLDNERYHANINRSAVEEPKTFTKAEAFRLTWRHWLPPVACGAATCAAVIGAQYVNTKRMAILAAGYMGLEAKHEEYREKVEELFGKKKVEQVDEAIYKDMVIKAKVGGVQILAGDVPCVDALTNVPFSSNMESLRKAANDINERIVHGDQPSVSDLYTLLGIPTNKLSDAFGWNDGNMCELKPTTVLNEDNIPVLVMDFSVLPIANYWKVGK